MNKKIIFLSFLFFYTLANIIGQEKDFTPNLQLLKTPFKSEFGFLTRKEILLTLNPKNLSVLIDLKAGQKDDFSKTIKTNNEETPLYHYLDGILTGTDLFYHIDKGSLYISSEWLWLAKEDTFQKDYDIANLYNEKEDLKLLISSFLAPFEMVNCKYEIKFNNARQCAITGNKHLHNYLNLFFLSLKTPITDYSNSSKQLIFSAEDFFKDKKINLSPATLSAEEWLILIGKISNEKINFNNNLTHKNLKDILIKIEGENESVVNVLNNIKNQIKQNIYYQKDFGIFFEQENMIKIAPLQNIQFRTYNINQISKKINGAFICQNIKDEIKKGIWITPGYQISYHKHLEAIIVSCPPQLFSEIDAFFMKLSQKNK